MKFVYLLTLTAKPQFIKQIKLGPHWPIQGQGRAESSGCWVTLPSPHTVTLSTLHDPHWRLANILKIIILMYIRFMPWVYMEYICKISTNVGSSLIVTIQHVKQLIYPSTCFETIHLSVSRWPGTIPIGTALPKALGFHPIFSLSRHFSLLFLFG